MNLIDLCFEYNIEISHEGDFYGGSYDLILNYMVPTQESVADAKTMLTLKQSDIDELHRGAKKLVKLLDKYVSKGY